MNYTDDIKQQLAERLRRDAIAIDEENGFPLAKGGKSNVYFDVRAALMDPITARLIGCGLEALYDSGNFDLVGGMESGAIPVVSAILAELYRAGEERGDVEGWCEDIRGFWVRKQPKGHGVGEYIAGLKPGQKLQDVRTLIVDDTFTTGGSTLTAVESAENVGMDVVAVIGVIDREQGAEQLFGSKEIYFDALFTAVELLPEGFVIRKW